MKNIQEFSYRGAIFYANILVTATDYSPEDVFLLASAYFGNKEHHRVLHLLEQNGLLKNINERNINSDLKHRFIMLAGQSYMETEQFEECVSLLSPGIVKKLGILTPEDLAEWDAEELFQIIDPIARSKEGKRILRGGNLPDLEEVTNWINFAQHHRKLQAA